MQLAPLPTVAVIHERLQQVFPEGTGNRNYLTREMAAKTVFVMLYVGAIEGNGYWLRPDQVTRMTDAQADLTADADRMEWAQESVKPTGGALTDRWYAANTREPIRDETLRWGLVLTGAVTERTDLPTTSPRGRYALTTDFAGLFDPQLTEKEWQTRIQTWQAAHLGRGALARIAIMRAGAAANRGDRVLVTFPNGETRLMEPGPSSFISKAVVESFAPRFLVEPSVIWLSESRNQVVARDDQLAHEIGLNIQPDRNLPDIVLVDLGPGDPLLVFVEVVATAGPVSKARRTALMEIARQAGFKEDQMAFLTAYADRADGAFRRTASELAWRSFVWFASEPDHLVALYDGSDTGRVELRQLMRNHG